MKKLALDITVPVEVQDSADNKHEVWVHRCMME